MWLKVDGKVEIVYCLPVFNQVLNRKICGNKDIKDRVILRHTLQNVRKSTEPKRRGRW